MTAISQNTAWGLLLRGVNVGGHNILKMADLRMALTDAGFQNVQTYIQSGNIILQSNLDRSVIYNSVRDVLKSEFTINVSLVGLSGAEIKAALDQVPFDGDPSKILIYFFLSKPETAIDLKSLADLAKDTEKLSILPRLN